jgi:hypothetical protein
MSAESEVIEHSFTVADATVTRFGFGIPLIAGNHSYWADRVKRFTNADDMTLSPYNMPKTHAIYKAAQKLKSQTPAPPEFKVGKLLGAITQSVELVPGTPAAGDVYSASVDGNAISVTADVAPSVAEICTALATAISAVADVTAVDGTTKVTVNGDTAGLMHSFESLSANLTLKDVTALPSPTPSTDLAAIRAADGDWYGLSLVNGGLASIEDAAAWAETQKVLYIAQTSDSGVPQSSVTSDVASAIKTAGYHRTGVLFHERTVEQQPAAGWLGVMLPKLPGPATWANKSIAGVDVSPLTDDARGALNTKRCNYYVAIKGLGFTLHGNAGSNRRLGLTVILDWFDVGVSDRVILMLHNNDNVPFTNKGIELARSQVEGQILEGIKLGLIDGEQAHFVTAPKVEDVNPVDKANAVLGDIAYSYVAVLGIEKVRIKGVVRV